MKKLEVNTSGYTKTQAILVILGITMGTLSLIQTTSAAKWLPTTNLTNAPVIGKEYIRAPEQSIVVLSEEEQEEKQKQLEQERLNQEPQATVYMMASAYNSVPGQTDGSPFRTASLTQAREGVIASNYFPIGTKLRIPDHFGDQIFRVEDRMNPRYTKTLDIWMEDVSDAKQWGRRHIKVEVVRYGLGRGVDTL